MYAYCLSGDQAAEQERRKPIARGRRRESKQRMGMISAWVSNDETDETAVR
jgi:hypothetical protein